MKYDFKTYSIRNNEYNMKYRKTYFFKFKCLVYNYLNIKIQI